MRVCHVWDIFWPLGIGGVERYIMSSANFIFKNDKIDFSLLTDRSKPLLITKNIKKFEDAGYLKVYRLGPSPTDLFSGFIYDAFGSMPKPVKKMRFASLCHEASKSSIAKSADIFHIHGIWGLMDFEYVNLGVFLSQHFHKPLVLTLHGSFIGYDPSVGGMPLGKPEVQEILRNYPDIITTYSKEVYGDLERMGLARKVRLITNFVDTRHFTNPSVTKKGDTVVFVARLENPQLPLLVIEAFKLVHARIPNAKLNIVGYGSLFDRMQSLIHAYGLEGVVSMVGKQTDVRKFLWNADIFVATNFGYMASLEAWSAGLAVVAPNFGVLKETVTHGQNGLLVDPGNSDQLASALITLLENKHLRDKLASNGMETAKNYDIASVVPKISAVYQSLLKTD